MKKGNILDKIDEFLDTVFFSKKIDTFEIIILIEVVNIVLLNNFEGYRNSVILIGKSSGVLNVFAIVLSFGTSLIAVIPSKETRTGVSIVVCEVLLFVILIRRMYYR